MKKNLAKIVALLILALVVAVGIHSPAQAASKPTVPATKTAYVDRTVTLSVSNKQSTDKVSFKSSNTKIATVGSTGKIVGKKAGTCKITTTVKRSSKTYTFTTNVTVKTAKLGNEPGNTLSNNCKVVTSSKYIYVTEGNYIYRYKTDGTGKKTVYKKTGGEFSNIQLYGSTLYVCFTSDSTGNSSIYKVSASGDSVKKLKSGCNISVANGYIYYSNNDGSAIYRMKTDGSSNKKLKSLGSDMMLVSLYCDGVRVYYSVLKYNDKTGTIADVTYFMSTAGNGNKAIVSDGYLVSVNGNILTYAKDNYETDKITVYKAAYDGTSPKKVVSFTGDGLFNALNCDGKYLYYSVYSNTSGTSKIYKIKLDGTGKTNFYTNKDDVAYGDLYLTGDKLTAEALANVTDTTFKQIFRLIDPAAKNKTIKNYLSITYNVEDLFD